MKHETLNTELNRVMQHLNLVSLQCFFFLFLSFCFHNTLYIKTKPEKKNYVGFIQKTDIYNREIYIKR